MKISPFSTRVVDTPFPGSMTIVKALFCTTILHFTKSNLRTLSFFENEILTFGFYCGVLGPGSDSFVCLVGVCLGGNFDPGTVLVLDSIAISPRVGSVTMRQHQLPETFLDHEGE